MPYGGRFFSLPHMPQFSKAHSEWSQRKDSDLLELWPKSELPYGFMTHMNNGGIPNHGFTHWWTMFNPRQLLVHALLLKAIISNEHFDWEVRQFVLGSFQQHLRNQSMFSFWHLKLDKLAPALSNSNFHPKSTIIEVGEFCPMGYGPWASTVKPLRASSEWSHNPWERVATRNLESSCPDLADQITGKSIAVHPGDPVLDSALLQCGSSSDLTSLADSSYDLVITDPPFGGLLHYSELSDFFYVWLRLVLKDRFPNIFSGEYTPKTLEVVANRARHPEDSDDFYKRLLTECWRESSRILKASGLLAFTFHHSEDEPWIAVLESLF